MAPSFGPSPRELTPAEVEERDRALKKKQEAEEQAPRASATTQSSLKLYASPRDVEEARDRKIRQFETAIATSKANLEGLKLKKQHLEEQAADREREGLAPSPDILDNLRILDVQIAEKEREIEARKVERQRVADQFDLDLDRIKLLYGPPVKATGEGQSGQLKDFGCWKHRAREDRPVVGPFERRFGFELAAYELIDPPLGDREQQIRHRIRRRCFDEIPACAAFAQDLPQLGLQAIEELPHARTQPVGFSLQCITGEQPREPGVAFRKRQQQPNQIAATTFRGGLFFENSTDAREYARFHELDQPLDHFGFAGKVAVKRGFRNPHMACKRGGGDARPRAFFEHHREGFENFLASIGAGHDGASCCSCIRAADQRADTCIGEYFEQDCMTDATVDDVGAANALGDRFERAAHLRQHAAVNRAVGDQRIDVVRPRDPVRVLPDLSRMPAVFVSNISFSAPRWDASLPATVSALML